MIKKITPEVASILLILLFGYAATSKLLVYDKFVVQIGQSALLADLSPFLAWIIPAVELIICVMLLLPKWRQRGFFAATVLMAAFTVYVFAVLFFSPTVPCSCGGILSQMGWKTHLVFNIVFTGIAWAGWRFEQFAHLKIQQA